WPASGKPFFCSVLMSSARTSMVAPNWIDAVVLRSAHGQSASACTSGIGVYADVIVAVKRTQPFGTRGVAEMVTPVRAVKRHCASRLAPTGGGKGAQTAQS